MKFSKNKLLILARDSDSYARIIRDASIEGLEIYSCGNPDEAKMHCEDVNIVLGEPDLIKPILSRMEHLEWDTNVPGQLRNKSIGKSIDRAAKFFQIITKGYALNPITSEYIDNGYTQGDDLTAFVQDLDYLVSTLPDTPATVGLLDSRIFSAMKPELILINVGRGNVLDEAALLDAVSNGKIAGAVLDVFKEEPLLLFS